MKTKCKKVKDFFESKRPNSSGKKTVYMGEEGSRTSVCPTHMYESLAPVRIIIENQLEKIEFGKQSVGHIICLLADVYSLYWRRFIPEYIKFDTSFPNQIALELL